MGDFRFEIWPTDYPIITQHFGINATYYSQFGLPGHDGIDIRSVEGGNIYCIAPGEVYLVHKTADDHNYGIHVRVEHRDGYRTIYGHLEEALVNEGQILEAGAILGTAGSTGNSFGASLHLTLKRRFNAAESPLISGPRPAPSSWPRDIIDPTPYLLPLVGWKEPAGPYLDGWLLAGSIFECADLGQVNIGGATFHISAENNHLLPAGTLVRVKAKKDLYRLVSVPKVVLGQYDLSAIVPDPEPPPLMATVDGWASGRYLVVVGDQAVVGSHGVTLRASPEKDALCIGMVKSGSTVSVLGATRSQFRPVRIKRTDFIEPVTLVDLPPVLNGDVQQNDEGSRGFFGWVLTQYLSPFDGNLALTSKFGVNLRNRPDAEGMNMGLVKAFATVRITGENENEYTPVSIRRVDVINLTVPTPTPVLPTKVAPVIPASQPAALDEEAIPGWAFTSNLTIWSDVASVSSRGSSLQAEPRRDAAKLGLIPGGSEVTVTGPAQGEYTPVRVMEAMLQPNEAGGESLDAESILLGSVRFGLHTSFDHEHPEEEHQAIAEIRPSIIAVQSTANFNEIERLAKEQQQAEWIIRAAASFEGKLVTPAQFAGDTVRDVRRIAELLGSRLVGVELHNQPNLVSEGLGSSWTDGNAFEIWWKELLEKYRSSLPGVRFLYPGLSLGGSVIGVKADHIAFLESSCEAIEAADGIAMHLFWSRFSGMNKALELLDDYSSRARSKPIWITQAGWVGPAPSAESTAGDYLRFWSRLQRRAPVQGVAFLTGPVPQGGSDARQLIGTEIPGIVGKR